MLYEFQHFSLSYSFLKEYGENFSFPTHLHQAFEFITVLSGEMTVIIDDKKYTLKAKESVLIFPNQLHSLFSTSSRHMLCIFSPRLISAYDNLFLNRVPVNNKFILNDYMTEKLDLIADDASVFEKKGLLYSICAEFDNSAAYEDKTSIGQADLLHKIFSFVQSNYKDDCLLNALSKNSGFSYSYLSRYFKNTTGISFNEYVNQYKISKACYYLNNTNMTILECALEVGYKSLRSFNRNFKLYMMKTPSEYRKP